MYVLQESRLPGLKRRSFLPSRKSHVPTTQGQTENLPPIQQPPLQPPPDKTATSKKFIIGDRVCISGVKTGRILYFGKFLLADGLWCGIELDEPVGKHDGEVEGVRYFTAKPGYGIFAPVNKVSVVSDSDVSDTVSHQTEASAKPEKVFRSKLQRRTLHYPKPASQLARDPEKGSSESLSSQSETGSEASSQSLVGSQVKKPKLSFVYKPSGIPKSGQTANSASSEGLEKTSGLRKPRATAFGKGIQPPGDYKNEGLTESIVPVSESETCTLNSTRLLESNQEEVDTSSLANRTQTLATNEAEALNQTQVIQKACEVNGQARTFEKRSQPDDNQTFEQDSKRPRFSQLPLSRLPQTGKVTTKVAENREGLNSTFVSRPGNTDLPIGSETAKGNATFSVPDQCDPEEVEAFSPEVHRQLVAGGRQYLNLTFDAEAKESEGGINVTHIVSAKNDDQDGEDLSELDSRLEFLRGDRHVGEATLYGILKPEEMDDTKLIASYLLDGSKFADPTDEGHKSRDNRQAELSSLGILPPECLETVDCTNFLADNPRIQALKHHAAGQAFRSRTGSDDFGIMENPLLRRESRVFSLDSNENFDLTGGVVTSTPLVSNLRRKINSVQASGTGENDQIPSTPEQLQHERLSSSIGPNLQDVRRNLDLTNNAYQEEIGPPGESDEKDVPADEVDGDNLNTESQPQVDELQNPPAPTSSVTSADAEASPAEMHTSLVLTDLLKADSKPMTDSGIDNVMTASQEMVASQTTDDRRLGSSGATVVDKLEQVLNESNQLAADLIAGHSKTDRPLSLISSVSSVDTGKAICDQYSH